MEVCRFQELIADFEKNIIVEGINRKRFVRKAVIPIKHCKLFYQTFGKIIGNTIDTKMILVIDYYGYIKKSKGFLEEINSGKYRKTPSDLRSHIIHFASIKMEDVAAMTSDVSAQIDFPRLKDQILILRGFRRGV